MLSLFLTFLLWPGKMTFASQGGNQQVANFSQAKIIAAALHQENPVTVYCPCKYHGKVVDLKSCGYQVQSNPKRAARLEWEHIVPAEAFGQSFKEWRIGDVQCVNKRGKSFKGRKCAGTNPEFARMEADLYNLWPIIGELNGLRSNYSMAEISGPARSFGGCKAKILDRKFEPMDEYKGIVARVYQYMDSNYLGRGVISNKNKKLFEAWDKKFPVSRWECQRASKILERQGNHNAILAGPCNSAFPLRSLSGQ